MAEFACFFWIWGGRKDGRQDLGHSRHSRWIITYTGPKIPLHCLSTTGGGGNGKDKSLPAYRGWLWRYVWIDLAGSSSPKPSPNSGVDLNREGQLTLLQVATPKDECFLFDVLALGTALFEEGGMRQLLEDKDVVKVCIVAVCSFLDALLDLLRLQSRQRCAVSPVSCWSYKCIWCISCGCVDPLGWRWRRHLSSTATWFQGLWRGYPSSLRDERRTSVCKTKGIHFRQNEGKFYLLGWETLIWGSASLLSLLSHFLFLSSSSSPRSSCACLFLFLSSFIWFWRK